MRRTFSKKYQCDSTGRFQASLPWRENVSQLGKSMDISIKQFYNLEKRLNQNAEMKRLYLDFMQTYEKMGHMTQVELEEPTHNKECYLPHYGVLKGASTTTKLRVVFNASASTSSGLSLNDVLKIGPQIQNGLFSTIVKFRKHNVVMVADIQKMYRQVVLNPDDREYQKLIWREDPSENLKCYRLNTITYGTASASFWRYGHFTKQRLIMKTCILKQPT